MIKLMTIFCMAGILTVNPVIIGLAEEESAVGAEPVAEEEEPHRRINTRFTIMTRRQVSVALVQLQIKQ